MMMTVASIYVCITYSQKLFLQFAPWWKYHNLTKQSNHSIAQSKTICDVLDVLVAISYLIRSREIALLHSSWIHTQNKKTFMFFRFFSNNRSQSMSNFIIMIITAWLNIAHGYSNRLSWNSYSLIRWLWKKRETMILKDNLCNGEMYTG